MILLVPHCISVPRDGWVGSHDHRPLSDAGHEQARALVAAIGPVDAVYSSPALRCVQTVQRLADAAGRPVNLLPELYETDDFREPAEWVGGVYAPMGQAISGAWVAGRALAALKRLPAGRVVVCSHGDVIPPVLALLAGASGRPLPPVVKRGSWHELSLA